MQLLHGENGLLNKASSARSKNDEATEDENNKLSGYEDEIAKYLSESDTGRAGDTNYESAKIANFTPTVTSDGNKIKISMQASDIVKGYVYFIDDKVKIVSGNSSEIVEVNETKKYKTYAVAIDEDGKFKKSSEVNITTVASESIFNGEETDTAKTGGFNASFTVSNSYNGYGYTTYNSKKCFELITCNSGNYGIAISKNKINVNDISSIKYILSGNTNHNDLKCNVFVGIAENNTANTTFIRSDKIEGQKTFDDKELNIDISDLSGEYYLKFITYHPTNVSAYGSYGYLYNIIANKKGIVE